MAAPDFKSYSIQELQSALAGVDAKMYPARAVEIEGLLKRRITEAEEYYRQSPPPVADRGVDETGLVPWKVAAAFWWAYLWRSVLFGGILGLILAWLKNALAIPKSLHLAAGLAFGAFLSIAVLRRLMRRSFRDFKVLVRITRDV